MRIYFLIAFLLFLAFSVTALSVTVSSVTAQETTEPSAAVESSPTETHSANEKVIEASEQAPEADESVQSFDTDNVSISINSDRIAPRRLEVGPGTTVAWINKAGVPVQVRFTGKAVSTTCKAPRGFAVDTAGVYVSDEIPQGEVVSLCFLEPELYVYEVSYLGSDLVESDTQEASPRLMVGSVHVRK